MQGGRFCCRTHAKRAGVARAKRRQEELRRRFERREPLCAHPHKLTYPSAELAQVWAVHDGLDAYLCVCGAWHLGHSNDEAAERLIRWLAGRSRYRGSRSLPSRDEF